VVAETFGEESERVKPAPATRPHEAAFPPHFCSLRDSRRSQRFVGLGEGGVSVCIVVAYG
jgi:hypothetical protein